MVQRKAPNKLSIKPLLLKSDFQSVNPRPLSPKSNDHKKIMKKPRPVTRSVEPRPLPPPIGKKRKHDAGESPQKQSPNYMKSTTSFDARKEGKTPTKKEKESSEKVKTLTKSLKAVKTLTKIPSFRNARRTTCSSTLKDSKFPSYLELSNGGSEVEGTSAVKVCPYNYCSLNGHHHAPDPPLRCFLAGKRRAMKTQKSFKLGCLSPRHTKAGVKKNEEIVREELSFAGEGLEEDMEVGNVTPVMEEEEEENRDFFVEIYSKDREDMEYSGMDWEEGYCSSSCVDDGKALKLPEIEDDDDREKQIQKTGLESLYNEVQELYDEESVSSGAWSESDDDYEFESESLYREVNRNHQNEMDEDNNLGIEEKMDEIQALNLPAGDHEEISRESETIHDNYQKSPEGTGFTDKHRTGTTIIYNIIQYNISIFINGEKTEHSGTEKRVTVKVAPTSGEMNEIVSDELPYDVQDSESTEQLNTSCLTDTQESPEREFDEIDACSQSNTVDFESDKQSEIDEEPSILSDEKPEISESPESRDEEPASGSEEKPAISGEEMTESSMDLEKTTRSKKPETEMEDSAEYNLRGPNFLPEVADPDAETVDLRHQMIDERKNAEEWMVDFALQQAVTTLKPARKKKVALLVEAFEKVIPTPKYESNNRHSSKAFTNSRPMQACTLDYCVQGE